MLGGSTALWGSFLTPLDASDFVARPSVALSGWPFPLGARALLPSRAWRFGLGPACFDAQLWPLFGAAPPAFDPARLHVKFWQLSSPSLFPLISPKRFGPAVSRGARDGDASLRVLLNASVASIVTASRAPCHAARAAQSRRAQARVTARVFVLAAGAIENARLLLISELGGDQVGRCFMEHPHARIGTLLPRDPRVFLETWAVRRRRGLVALQPALCPTPIFQAEHDILNASVSVEIDRHPECPTLAFSDVATAPGAAATAAARPQAGPHRPIPRGVRRERLAPACARQRRDPACPGAGALWPLGAGAEPGQPRYPRARARCAGLRRARLAWRLTDRDRRTVARWRSCW